MAAADREVVDAQYRDLPDLGQRLGADQPGVTRGLKRQGIAVGRRVVTRLMRAKRHHRDNPAQAAEPDQDRFQSGHGPGSDPARLQRADTAAHRNGLPAGNAIMHTDRGSQYHAKIYCSTLQRLDIRQNTGRTGSYLDGAESFFATIKTEIGTDSWPDRTSARRGRILGPAHLRWSLRATIAACRKTTDKRGGRILLTPGPRW